MTSIASTPSTASIKPPPAAVFHLSAGGELRPVTAPEPDLPPHVSGLAAFYYWKDAIVVGSYVHPSRQFSIDITRDRLDGYADNFQKMKSNGVGVPILMDHAQSAAATLGWIVDVKRQDDRLMELHQFLGEAARDVGLRNKVSLGIDPDFVDGKGVRYGEAIVHSAVTPVPVVPGQGEFQALARDEDDSEVFTLSLAAPIEATGEQSPSPGTPGEGGGEGDFGDQAIFERQNHPHPNPLPAYRARGPECADIQLALSAMIDAAAAKRDLAVARGAIAPAVADELFALLVRSSAGVINTMCLSRASSTSSSEPTPPPLALAIFDALSRNRPAPLGEATRLQVLSRAIPGDDAASELQQRMIALASGRST